MDRSFFFTCSPKLETVEQPLALRFCLEDTSEQGSSKLGQESRRAFEPLTRQRLSRFEARNPGLSRIGKGYDFATASLSGWLLGLVVTVLTVSPMVAVDPAGRLVNGRVSKENGHVGASVALSDRFILVGEPDANFNTGEAHVFDAKTGKYLRQLKFDGGVRFGHAVAICGNRGLVSEDGAVLVFDLGTGKQVDVLVSTSEVPDFFGYSVAASGAWAVAGELGSEDEVELFEGRVHLFDLVTGDHKRTIERADPEQGEFFGGAIALSGDRAVVSAGSAIQFSSMAVGNYADLVDVTTGRTLATFTGSGPSFGWSVAIDGDMVLIGQPNHTAGDPAGPGVVQVRDIVLGSSRNFSVPSGTTGNQFGRSVAVQGNVAIVGAPGVGKAYLIDLKTDTFLFELNPEGGVAGDGFGENVSLAWNQAVLGASKSEVLGQAEAGSVRSFTNVCAPMALVTKATTGLGAPGAPDAQFKSFGVASSTRTGGAKINEDGEIQFDAKLTGLGSNRGLDTGVWSDLEVAGELRNEVKSRLDLSGLGSVGGLSYAGVMVNSVFNPLLNRSDLGVCQATLSGPRIAGVSTRNNLALLGKTVAGVTPLLRTSQKIPIWDNAEVSGIKEVLVSRDADAILVATTLRTGTGDGVGAPKVSSKSDSAIAIVDREGRPTVGMVNYREGQPSPILGRVLGQIAATAGTADDALNFAFQSYTVPSIGSSGPSLLMLGKGAFAAAGSRVVMQGEPIFPQALPPEVALLPLFLQPISLSGLMWSSFTGETVVDGKTIWRATLKGPRITSANSQTLWSEKGNKMLLRTGDLFFTVELGLKVSRIEKFWPLHNGVVMVQVLLSGPGVNSTNKRALYLLQEDGVWRKLFRGGDRFSGSDCPKVGNIIQVDADPASGAYVILASLTGVSSAANQGLFTGYAFAGDSTTRAKLRDPVLKLRKGMGYAVNGSLMPIRSLALASSTNVLGVGSVGRGHVVNQAGQVVIHLEYGSKVREIMVGRP